MLAPATVFKPSSDASAGASSSLTPPTFTDEQIALYEKRFKEGFDVHDPQYELWVKENHRGSSDADSMKTHISKSVSTVSSGDLSEILKYPEAKVTSKAKKPAINSSNAVYLSDSPAVRQLKDKEEQKRHSAEEKVRKKEERERKKEEREREKLLKVKEKEKRQEREIKRRQKEKEKAKKRISSRRVKKAAVDISDLSNSEGDEVSNSALNALCVMYVDSHVNGFVVTIATYGFIHTAQGQILIDCQICSTV